MATIRKEDIFDSKYSQKSIDDLKIEWALVADKIYEVNGGEMVIKSNKSTCEFCGNTNNKENQTCYGCGANIK